MRAWQLMGTYGNFVRSNSVRACVMGTYGNFVHSVRAWKLMGTSLWKFHAQIIIPSATVEL